MSESLFFFYNLRLLTGMESIMRNIDQKYQYIGFLPNSIRIKENGFWGLNDYEGNSILPSNYIEVFTLASGYGLIAARGAGYWDIFDYHGNKLNSERIDSIYPYYGMFGMTKIRVGEKWGMINKFGRIIIPIEYCKIDKFGKGVILKKNELDIEFIERKDLIKLTVVNNKPLYEKVTKPTHKKMINISKMKAKTIQ